MIFMKATVHKDQLSVDFEWPGKVRMTEAELAEFIRRLRKVQRKLLPSQSPLPVIGSEAAVQALQ